MDNTFNDVKLPLTKQLMQRLWNSTLLLLGYGGPHEEVSSCYGVICSVSEVSMAPIVENSGGKPVRGSSKYFGTHWLAFTPEIFETKNAS